MTSLNSTGLVLADGQVIKAKPAADWDAAVRYIAVDYDGGNDTNAGFSDVDADTAGGVAKKTVEAALNILPFFGAGRSVVLLIKNRAAGAIYKDALAADTKFELRTRGYASIDVVGTTDFSDDATDQIRSGCVISDDGPNGDDSWTCAGGGTGITFSVSAGTLPAMAGLRYRRVRFKGNVTAGLANKCAAIYSSTSSAITVAKDLPEAPASGDEFFIEKAGVAFTTVFVDSDCQVHLKGLASTDEEDGAFMVQGSQAESGAIIRLCEARGASSTTYIQANTTVILDEATWGWSFRAEGTLWLRQNDNLYSGTCLAALGETPTLISLSRTTGGSVFGLGSSFGGQVILEGCGGSGSGATFVLGDFTFGGPVAGIFRPLLVFGADADETAEAGVLIKASNVTLQDVKIENVGEVPGVKIQGSSRVVLQAVTGTTGNNDVGVDLTDAIMAEVKVQDSTVAGTVGQLRLAGGEVTPFSPPLDLTNIVDGVGNRVQKLEGAVTFRSVQVINQSGGSLVIGNIVRPNGTGIEVVKAQADDETTASGPLFVMITNTAVSDPGRAVELGSGAWVKFDAGGPTPGAQVYLDDGTAGLATTTEPTGGGNYVRRLGHVFTVHSGDNTYARVWGSVDREPEPASS